MAGQALITIDGVLADQGDESSFAASKFLPEGVLIYKALASITKIVLVSLQPEREKTKVEYWLKAHGLQEHVRVIYDPSPDDLERGLEMVVGEVRRSGALDVAIEADSQRAARLVHHGVPTLVFGRPAYTRGEFKPGTERTARPWQEVIEELDAQRGMNTEDERISADVAGTRYE